MNVTKLKEQKWRELYYQYKDTQQFILASVAGIFILCAVLIFTAIIPQVKNFISIQKEAARTQQIINTIRNNTETLKQLPDDVVNNNFQTATDALPTEKNFIPIISAVYAASLRSGAAVDDFSFSLGASNGVGASAVRTAISINNNLALSLSVRGSVQNIKSFITELQQKLPLAEVTSVSGQPDGASVDVKFYFKDFPKLSYTDTEPLPTVSHVESSLLNTLAQWDAAGAGALDSLNSGEQASGAAATTKSGDPF